MKCVLPGYLNITYVSRVRIWYSNRGFTAPLCTIKSIYPSSPIIWGFFQPSYPAIGNPFLECNALIFNYAYGDLKALQRMRWPTHLNEGVGFRSNDGRILPHGERLVG